MTKKKFNINPVTTKYKFKKLDIQKKLSPSKIKAKTALTVIHFKTRYKLKTG